MRYVLLQIRYVLLANEVCAIIQIYMAMRGSVLIGYIFKLIFASSDSFCLIASQLQSPRARSFNPETRMKVVYIYVIHIFSVQLCRILLIAHTLRKVWEHDKSLLQRGSRSFHSI